jgi:hypothetical protein
MAMKKCVKNMLRMARPDWEMNQWTWDDLGHALDTLRHTYCRAPSRTTGVFPEHTVFGRAKLWPSCIVSGDIQSLYIAKDLYKVMKQSHFAGNPS